MSGLIASMAGAPQAASTAGGFYQGAANQVANEYGSPAANMFSQMEMAKLQPNFQQMINQASAQAAAQGITGSGAGRANLGNVAAQNAGTLAGAVSPLYQQGLGDYAGILSQMPGAQEGAYQGSVQDFLSMVQTAAMAAGGAAAGGAFSGGGGGGGSMIQPAQQVSGGAGASYYAPGGYMQTGYQQ